MLTYTREGFEEMKIKQAITGLAGNAGGTACISVVKVHCLETNSMGTGFIHKSGRVITASHVVNTVDPSAIIVVLPSTQQVMVTEIVRDPRLDLALLTLNEDVRTKTLPIASEEHLTTGTMITTWGFPSGYNGDLPIVTVGFLSGRDITYTEYGGRDCWIINAAVNLGNSGGPLIDIHTNSVIGVVISKIAPIPIQLENELNMLGSEEHGFIYEKELPDGSVIRVNEGKVVSEVLKHLRKQTQLVIGQAVLLGDLKRFLLEHKITP